MIQSCTVLGLLGVCSIEDIRHKRVGFYEVCLCGIAGIIIHLFDKNISIFSLMGGMLLGIVVLLFSKLSNGAMGIGDGLVLLVTGVYLGGANNIQLFLSGIILAGLWSLVLVLFFHKGRKYEIPFIPFLLIAYVGMLL